MSYRETIASTLLTFLANAAGVTAASRRFTPYDEVASGDYPYLILMQDREIIDPSQQQAGAFVAEHRMQFKVLLYALGDGTEQAIAATGLNNMLDAIETALRPVGMLRTQNMGLGYVLWTVINGPIEYDGSAYGNYGVAVIPIEVAYS